MAVVLVPKALDRVKKSLECFGQSTDCLCALLERCVLCYYHEKITCCVMLWAVPRRTAGLCLSPCELSLCYYYKLNNMIYGY